MSAYRLTSLVLRNNMFLLVQESIDEVMAKIKAATEAIRADKEEMFLSQPTIGLDLTGWHGGRVRVNALDILYLEERAGT